LKELAPDEEQWYADGAAEVEAEIAKMAGAPAGKGAAEGGDTKPLTIGSLKEGETMEVKDDGRDDAPIKAETWNLLDQTMVEAAKSILAGRRLLSIEGPYGLGLKGVPLEDCSVGECLLVSKFVPVHMISTTFPLGVRDL